MAMAFSSDSAKYVKDNGIRKAKKGMGNTLLIICTILGNSKTTYFMGRE